MSTYRLYKSPNGDIVRVKMGFSWRAFFVGSMSAVIRRTWLLFVVAALYYASEAYFYGVPTPTSRTAGVALAAVGLRRLHALLRRQRQPVAERFAAPPRLHADRRRAALKTRGVLRAPSAETSVQEPAALA